MNTISNCESGDILYLGQGDLSLCAEQNFMFDPEAAHIVLQEIKNAYILPYEISQRHCIPFVSVNIVFTLSFQFFFFYLFTMFCPIISPFD